MDRMLQFSHQSCFSAPVERLFAFHERDDIFTLLLPPWQRVRVISRSGGLQTGARVEFRLLFGPFYKTWVAFHTEYERNRLFTDVQEKGPFAYWRHQHIFQRDGAGSILRDQIEYSLPLSLDPVLGWLIEKDLRRMFDYRHKATAKALFDGIE